MNNAPLTFPAARSVTGLASLVEGALYGFTGRDLRIAQHLNAMRTGEAHRINGLVVRCNANSAGCSLSFDVGASRHLSIRSAVDAIRAALPMGA